MGHDGVCFVKALSGCGARMGLKGGGVQLWEWGVTGGRLMMGAWRGNRTGAALGWEQQEARSTSQFSRQPGWLPHGLWPVSSSGRASQLLTMCPCPTDGLFALLGGPQLLPLLPVRPRGFGRWRGGLHSFSSSDPENNPYIHTIFLCALTSSSYIPH